MAQEAQVYESGNTYQNQVYQKMADYLEAQGITRFGTPNNGKTPYRHLLPQDSTIENFLFRQDIFIAAESRFKSHKAGDWLRARTNAAASQPCCFNLFVPLQKDLDLASKLFSSILGSKIVVSHIEIEFTPKTSDLEDRSGFKKGKDADESIGDQGKWHGTDADVAIFYREGERRGVILIEFKYIESGSEVSQFSRTCSSGNRERQI